MGDTNWLDRYYELAKKNPKAKRERIDKSEIKQEQLSNKTNAEQRKVVAFLNYLFYNRRLTPITSTHLDYQIRGHLFHRNKIDFGAYVGDEPFVKKTRDELRDNYATDLKRTENTHNELISAIEKYITEDTPHLKLYKGELFFCEPLTAQETKIKAVIDDKYIDWLRAEDRFNTRMEQDEYMPKTYVNIFKNIAPIEEALFIYILIHYPSKKERELLNRDKWEIIDYYLRLDLLDLIERVLELEKWKQVREYFPEIRFKLMFPVMYRISAAYRIIANKECTEKADILFNRIFKLPRRILHQIETEFVQITKGKKISTEDEYIREACGQIIKLDEIAETILLDYEKEYASILQDLKPKYDTDEVKSTPTAWICVPDFKTKTLNKAISDRKKSSNCNKDKFINHIFDML